MPVSDTEVPKKRQRKSVQIDQTSDMAAPLDGSDSAEAKVLRALIGAVEHLQSSVDVLADDLSKGLDNMRIAAVTQNDDGEKITKLLQQAVDEQRKSTDAIREQTQLNRDSLAVLAICDRLTANQARELRKIAARYLAEAQAKSKPRPMPMWLLCTLWLLSPAVVFLAGFGLFALFR